MSVSDVKEGGDIERVEVDALVILQIMKHCRQHSPHAVTGQLLGLDVDSTMQVTHSFGYVQKGSEEANQQDDGEQYTLDMQRLLREVNADANTIGWYQTTHLGQFFSNVVIETQYLFQREIPRSILLVYDPLQAAIGKPSFKALRLTPAFMTRHAELQGNTAALNDFPASEMFLEVPVYIHSPAIVEAFLVDWSLMDATSTTQIEALDTENQVFLERNMQLLISALQDLAEEQQKLQNFERQAGRQQQPEKGKGRGYGRNQASAPRQLDTMILSQQIQNYCKQINDFSGDSFGKLFLLSNKPASLQEA
jgi:translation initiation factor 3 subunit H